MIIFLREVSDYTSFIQDDYRLFNAKVKGKTRHFEGRVWLDFLASDFKFILAFRKLGLFGFVFLEPEGGFILIILCDKDGCAHFWPFGNWV